MPEPGVIRFKRPTPVKDFLAAAWRGLTVALVIGAGVGGVWYVVEEGLFILPESQVDQVVSFAKSFAEKQEAPVELVPSIPDEFDVLVDRLRMEHAGALRSLPPDQTAAELCWRGRNAMLGQGNEDLALARSLLEMSIVMEPRNALALAGLAEVYALLGASDPSRSELLVAVQGVLNRADALGDYGLERRRARVVWLLSAENHGEAGDLAREALRTHPNDGHFHFLNGIAQAPNPKAVEATIGSFRRALELEPEMERVWLEIGRLEERRHRYGPAATAYRAELAMNSGSSETHRLLGLLMERVGEFEAAVDHYRRSVLLDPLQADLALRRAVISYQVEGRPQQARTLLRRLLAGEHGVLGLTERQEVQVHLAAVMRVAGDFERSIRIAEELLEDDPTYSAGLFQLGLSQIGAGQVDEGEGALLRLDASGFNSLERARVHFHAGHAALTRGRTQDAISAFDRAIEARPDFVPAYFWLTAPRIGRGDAEASVQPTLRLVGKDPLEWGRRREVTLVYGPVPKLGDVASRLAETVSEERAGPKVTLALALSYFHDGQLARAESLLRSVLQKDARSEGAKFHLGLLALGRGQVQAALSLFEGLIATSHNNGVYHAYLGEALRRAGRNDEALSSLERAKAYGVRDAWVETRLGMIQARLGREAEALASLERAESGSPESLGPRIQRYHLGL